MRTPVKIGASVAVVVLVNAMYSLWIAADVLLLSRDLSVVDGMSLGATLMMSATMVILNRVKEMIKNGE
tara:strand:+ start:87 stop:293 length:207 start_codon:yes stop_codon:yes gene_type:complete